MQKNDVLATVGNRTITRGDVETLLHSLNPQTAAQFQSEEGIRNLTRELASQELFYLDAIDRGMDKDAEYLQEVDRAKANILKQYALGSFLDSVKLTESEIADFYNENKAYFASPARVKASHILVDDAETAEKISEEIRNGRPFEEAAGEYSKCPSKNAGGDLGDFTRGRMVPEFENAAFDMEKGQISAPVKTQFGYHLIKVYDKQDAGQQSLDEARDQIVEQLTSQKQQDVYAARVNELKSKYEIKFNI